MTNSRSVICMMSLIRRRPLIKFVFFCTKTPITHSRASVKTSRGSENHVKPNSRII